MSFVNLLLVNSFQAVNGSIEFLGATIKRKMSLKSKQSSLCSAISEAKVESFIIIDFIVQYDQFTINKAYGTTEYYHCEFRIPLVCN